MRTFLFVAFGLFVGIAPAFAAEPASSVVLASEVDWEQLNPARGDRSPKAGTLWGDRKGAVATGFLVQFVDGFSSPPHIHNVSYRGVVIEGLIHNDDPDAAQMWMPAGSFWTQPKGEVHITAAKGKRNIAYIEIENGPYLVRPPEDAFDSGERPVNVDPSNIVWLDAANIDWMDSDGPSRSPGGPKVAFLWGDPNPQSDRLNGSLIKLPAGFTGLLRSDSSIRAVVIHGSLRYQVPGNTDVKVLEPGSYFSSMVQSAHQMASEGDEGCMIYVRAEGDFELERVRP